MKKLFIILLVLMTVISLAACGKTTSELPLPPDEPSTTPPPEPYVPMDIFGDEFNPYGMDSPNTVFAASFMKGSKKLGSNQFVLSMTGSGNMYACVAYHADVAGLSEEEKEQRITEYLDGGFTEFEGKDGYIVTIKQADPNDDNYEYVTADGSHGQSSGGCVISITFFINDTDLDKYTKLVSDNYNLAALAVLSDYMDLETDFTECDFEVNLHKHQAAASVVYHLSDVAAIQKNMESAFSGDWWEWNGMKETSVQYTVLNSKLTFDSKGGAITINQKNIDLNIAAGEYGKHDGVDVSLAKLGFGFDDKGTCGVYEQHEPYYMSIAIHRPEWGEWNQDWNIEYMDQVNGYTMLMWYYTDEGKWHIAIEGDNGGSYDYYPTTGKHDGHPENIPQVFNTVFGTQGDDFYDKPLAYFEQVVKERFDMNVDNLYSLPIR